MPIESVRDTVEKFDFELDFGGIPDDDSSNATWTNKELFQNAIHSVAALASDSDPKALYFQSNKVYHMMGGIYVQNIANFVLWIDGTIKFSRDRHTWPWHDDRDDPFNCIELRDIRNVQITSSSSAPGEKGVIDGSGSAWWGIPLYVVSERDI